MKNKPSTGNKKQSLQKEKATAKEMWLMAMETMGKTQNGLRQQMEWFHQRNAGKSFIDPV